MKTIKTVDLYIESKRDWSESLILLREVFEATRLQETIKWGIPTYTLKGKNVASFSAFKSYVGIWFLNGVFLKDQAKKLLNAQEGVTRAQRQWRFQNPDEIRENRDLILAYLEEAIQNQDTGKILKPRTSKPLEIPPEFETSLKNNPALKDRFQTLTLSQQREYCEYIRQAKREETREKRLQKICPMILKGVGLNDKYKK